jgi:hypothetical protein
VAAVVVTLLVALEAMVEALLASQLVQQSLGQRTLAAAAAVCTGKSLALPDQMVVVES